MTPTADFRSEVVDLRIEDRIALVTLNRPASANALDEQLIRDLGELWRTLAADRGIRCIVLTGAGRHFCAGADVSMLASDRTEVGRDADEELSFLPGRVVDVPVIVAVNGTCAGGGLHFVADADIVIAADGARFIDSHVSVGQVSGIEPVELMTLMRRDRAVRMALLGRHEIVDAATALDSGLVSEVLAAEDLLEHALDLAHKVCSGSPTAVRHTRRVIRAYLADSVRSYRDLGWELVQRHWAHPDSKEGPAAFQEKREPHWAE
ncbi:MULTISPECIES: enoyl-CoA hydratase/isomerase family protein [unclassified Microbacterium]|uniref:enoyl-CoA hydratase/isomerase family protein n=1 Tax=unclassified Microbacterium TaxID=2609290 RepID=UPI00214BB1D9|nr:MULTISPECIES: enoyl-CoA hydratase/isomerase family protein [unclassified Microbacterium]MCR2783408.1 enoyl-CoA hydratase/isomerase family protein [Microbacterium sp. zg.B96]MDL5351806.1 enoyl-CoA hydratase/isomerase family protein [Microbacterium sp. zg-YB36]WIM15723.1 enoyl-CoA hydratase/isomerase family protein [Microbacterium sp. zg-B96]